jgi:FHS family Na+ dependent glucose MFS transporter 1
VFSVPSQPSDRILPTVGYYWSIFALGLAVAVFGPTLLELAEQTHVGLAVIGFVFVAISAGYMLGSLVGGYCLDHLPAHKIVAAALSLMALTIALVPFIMSYWPLMTVLLLFGMGEGVVDVGGNTLVGWVHRENAALWFNGLHFSFGLGAFFAPVIVSLTMHHPKSLVLSYGILAALMLPCIVLLWRLASPRQSRVKKGGRAYSRDRRLIILFVLFLGLYVGAEIGFNGWIFTYAVTLRLTSEMTGAYLTSLFWAALTLGRLLAIPIATRFRHTAILLADLVGCLASLTVMIIGSDVPVALWAGTLGIGLSMASIFPISLALAGQRMELTGGITSWFIVGSSAGSIVLPWTIGRFLAVSGPQIMMVILLFDLACAGLLLTGIIALSKQHKADYPVCSPTEAATIPSISA